MKNILFVILFFPVVLSAQRTVFVDTLAEYCLLEHLSLRVGDSIPQRAFDTITKLNCSGFGLSQIVDFAPCQNLKSINLSYNNLNDVTILASLPKLRYADLSNNQLSSIDVLAFPASDTLTLLVGNNYIRDFSLFFNNTFAIFTLIGTQNQRPTTPIIRLNSLKSILDTSVCNRFTIKYSGWTNSNLTPLLKFGDNTQENAIADGFTHTVTHTYQRQGKFIITMSIGDSLIRDSVVTEILANPTLIYRNDSLISSYRTGNKWFYNGVLVDSITTYAFKPKKSGNYKVQVKSISVCISTSNEMNITLTSNKELLYTELVTIYPNPTNGQFMLEIKDGITLNNAKVTIFNIIGQVKVQQTFSGQKILFDLSKQPQGTYFVELKTESGVKITRKILKL